MISIGGAELQGDTLDGWLIHVPWIGQAAWLSDGKQPVTGFRERIVSVWQATFRTSPGQMFSTWVYTGIHPIPEQEVHSYAVAPDSNFI